jgi:hypothetical protein
MRAYSAKPQLHPSFIAVDISVHQLSSKTSFLKNLSERSICRKQPELPNHEKNHVDGE